jgi:hypothetical protein
MSAIRLGVGLAAAASAAIVAVASAPATFARCRALVRWLSRSAVA